MTSKRRLSFPSETNVKRGQRIVRSDIEPQEKLGRNDLCPCGSGLRFQAVLFKVLSVRRVAPRPLFLGIEVEVEQLSEAANIGLVVVVCEKF